MDKVHGMVNQQPLLVNLLGNLSGFGANHHLRQCLVFLNMPTVQQPEAYLANSPELFDGNGKVE